MASATGNLTEGTMSYVFTLFTNELYAINDTGAMVGPPFVSINDLGQRLTSDALGSNFFPRSIDQRRGHDRWLVVERERGPGLPRAERRVYDDH